MCQLAETFARVYNADQHNKWFRTVAKWQSHAFNTSVALGVASRCDMSLQVFPSDTNFILFRLADDINAKAC